MEFDTSHELSAGSNNPEAVYSVSEINEALRAELARLFSHICIRGEVSGAKKSAKGHIYFDLKDAHSFINCVLFKWSAPKFCSEIKDGMQMRVWGNISVYNSRYQIYVNNLEEEGIGQLQIAFERLKQKLKAEGLFNPQRKRLIPPFPSLIGIVTSPSGAAIKDIISVLNRRGGNLCIILAPALVQGKSAAAEIAAAIKLLNDNFPDMDVMLVGRGGGSLEDLWCFNEELVARAISESKIPIISCIGHETDTTIADFAADKRAETPSAAAEMVVKSRQELLQKVIGLSRQLMQSLRLYYERLSGRLMRLRASRVLADPFLILERPARRLDEASERLSRAASDLFKARKSAFNLCQEKLKALSPLAPLKKGYAMVIAPSGKAVRSIKELKTGLDVQLNFFDGKAIAKILHSNPSTLGPKPLRKSGRKKKNEDSNQEMLW